MLGFFKDIRKAITLKLLVSLVEAFGLGFATYYFHTQGVEFYKLMMIWAIGPLVSLPIVSLLNSWNTRTFLRLGALAYTGMALSLFFFNPYSFLLYGVFEGLKLGFFWVSFNYIFFRRSTNHNHARNSSVYFILTPLVGMILPAVGAVFIDNLGFKALFLATGLFSLLPLLYIKDGEFGHVAKRSFRDAEKAFSGLRLITFFDAALHFFQHHFLLIYALLFLNTEYEIGGLLSYLAFISLVASFLVAYVSDRLQRRVELLYPLLIPMGILIAIIPAFDSLSVFVALVGIYAILDNLSLPIRFAIPMDMTKTDIGFWRVNEFYGNIGRTVVFGVSALLLYLGKDLLPFLIFAAMTVAFPFIISRKVKWMRGSSVRSIAKSSAQQ